MMLQSIISCGSGFADISKPELKLTSGSEFSENSMSWFNAFESAKFPTIVCDKKYFFLYSTDHDTDGSGGNTTTGAIWWGKGDNLDLSDFQEVALIIEGYQAETPYPVHLPFEITGHNEEFHLYYHTAGETSAYNTSVLFQSSRLLTTVGGAELHNCTWTDRGTPLEPSAGDDHLGYLMPYLLSDNTLIATHITKAGLPQPWANSVSSDGQDYTRGETIDTYTNVEEGYFAQLSEGRYFEKYNQAWWIGQIHPEDGSVGVGDDRLLIIAKADKIGGAITQKKLLNNGQSNIRHSVKIEEETAHIYITNPVSKLFYATYDLRNLPDLI
jgi:hypothetical protein